MSCVRESRNGCDQYAVVVVKDGVVVGPFTQGSIKDLLIVSTEKWQNYTRGGRTTRAK